MQRQIKFRAWQKQPSLHRPIGMYVVNDIVWYDKPDDGNTGEVFFRSYTSSEYLEDVELMQYTGLKDKNGVEIYEGDVVLYDHVIEDNTFNAGPDAWVGEKGLKAIVEHPPGFFGLREGNYTNGKPYYKKALGWDIGSAHLEVIGNIYSNPELLSKEESNHG